MQTNEKKAEEKSFLNRFVELDANSYEDFQINLVDPPDGFLVRDGQKISIEISKLFNTQGERVIQERKFVKSLKDELKSESLKWSEVGFAVTWRFNFPFDFRLKQQKKLRTAILNLVKDQLIRMKPESTIEVQPEYLLAELDRLAITKSSVFPEPVWVYENYWMSGELGEKLLNQKINEKNSKAGYIKEYSQNWLLLVIEERPHSSFAGFKDDGYKLNQDCVFDRIVIMEPTIENRLFEVLKQE